MAESRYGADSNFDRGFICNGTLLVDRCVKYETAFSSLS